MIEIALPGRINILNLGCARRSLDARRFADYFQRNGWTLTPGPGGADVILLVTCAYIKEEADKALFEIQKLSRCRAALIVSGCLPAIAPDALHKNFTGPVVHPHHLDAVDSIFPSHTISFSEIPDSNRLWNEHPSEQGEETRFLVRIGQGCLGNCAFCAIRRATGELKSKPLPAVLEEVQHGLDMGYQRFQLLSEDVGAYGLDLDTNITLLLEEIFALSPDLRVKMDDFRPLWLIRFEEEMLQLAQTGRIYHILSPVQSGSSRVLRSMNRFHDSQRMVSSFRKLISAHKNLKLITNCIIGFPTETEADFQETLDVLEKIHFHAGRIFPYSERDGTTGQNLGPPASRKIILERFDHAHQELRRMGYSLDFDGQTLSFMSAAV